MYITATWIIPKPFKSVLLSPFLNPRWEVLGGQREANFDASTILQNNTRIRLLSSPSVLAEGLLRSGVSKATLNLAEAESGMGAAPPQAGWVGPSL